MIVVLKEILSAMEMMVLKAPLEVIGFRVDTFPKGIDEAFERLMNMLPHSDSRPLFGLTEMDPGGIAYYAAALRETKDDIEQTQLIPLEIRKGEYYVEELENWRRNLSAIPHLFHRLLQLPGLDRQAPCVEWYENQQRMLCMVKKA